MTITVLDNNTRISHLELLMYTNLLESSVGPCFQDFIQIGQPLLQSFVLTGVLKIYLERPSMTDVQFYTDQEQREYSQAIQSHRQEFLNGPDKADATINCSIVWRLDVSLVRDESWRINYAVMDKEGLHSTPLRLVQYLAPQDMARCIAACKTFASIFEPYLYRQVTLGYRHPLLSVLPRDLQHVRMLKICGRFIDRSLQSLAGALDLPESTSKSLTAPGASANMTNLRRLTLNSSFYGSASYSTTALNTIIDILHSNSGITHLELRVYADLLESSIGSRLLDLIRSGLPQLQRFILVEYNTLSVAQATEALKICFGHPSLTDAQFYTERQKTTLYRSTDTNDALALQETDAVIKAHFDALLEYLETGVQFQRVDGCRLTSLALPYIKGGYPRTFLLPLLRIHLPKLERFEVPILDGPYEGELEEVIAGHCRNLQHVSYTFPSDIWEPDSNAIKAVIRGCAKWSGLKSIRVFGYKQSDTDSSHGLVGMLVEHHSKTLESIEFKAWNYWEGTFVLDSIFTGCPNLKSLKILPIEDSKLVRMNCVNIPADPWVFQGLKELHLRFAQKDQYLEDIETAKQELEAGGRMFKQIGKLIHLEVLALDFFRHSYWTPSEWELDDSIEDKWVQELAGLDNLRYLYIPWRFLERNELFIDSSWPRLERVSSRDLHPQDFGRFHWLKARRPWLEIGDFELRTEARLMGRSKLMFNITCNSTWTYEQVILDAIINILDNNSGLTHLELQMYTDLPESSIDPRLLDVLRTGLPRLQRFVVSGRRAFTIVQAMEALEICLGHPSLTDVQFYTYEEREQYSQATESIDQTHFESLLDFLNGFGQAGQQFQRANGCRLRSLALPYIEGGYPRTFLLPLLRTYLPRLERFEIPAMDVSYESELEEISFSQAGLEYYQGSDSRMREMEWTEVHPDLWLHQGMGHGFRPRTCRDTSGVSLQNAGVG
ncbi:MAG: hypothetical protein J3Q66DRAFT_366220 [Benniella sp.]|nr:MAG: hypothetical protein J3Q66DRAFT_366220 [Benniella sp.]